MDCNVPKNEREHWAAREIARLLDENALFKCDNILHPIMEFCDQPDVTIARNFDHNSSNFGWWWVGWRNGQTFEAPTLLLAINRAQRKNQSWTP